VCGDPRLNLTLVSVIIMWINFFLTCSITTCTSTDFLFVMKRSTVQYCNLFGQNRQLQKTNMPDRARSPPPPPYNEQLSVISNAGLLTRPLITPSLRQFGAWTPTCCLASRHSDSQRDWVSLYLDYSALAYLFYIIRFSKFDDAIYLDRKWFVHLLNSNICVLLTCDRNVNLRWDFNGTS
jgi:hypothetical protein